DKAVDFSFINELLEEKYCKDFHAGQGAGTCLIGTGDCERTLSGRICSNRRQFEAYCGDNLPEGAGKLTADAGRARGILVYRSDFAAYAKIGFSAHSSPDPTTPPHKFPLFFGCFAPSPQAQKGLPVLRGQDDSYVAD
ncbi:MAG: hypothetical protein ACI3V3_02175, partial [Faecousia sp.]